MPAVDELADFYAAAPQNGGTVGTDIFKLKVPAQPDACVTFFQYPGGPVELAYGRVIAETVMVQVQVRASTRDAAQSKCYDVFKKLTFDPSTGQPRANLTIGGTLYYFIRGVKSPALLRIDQSPTSRELPVFYCELSVRKAFS